MSIEAPLPRQRGAQLSEDERDRAMLVLAMNGGHAGKAHAQLAAEGLSVSERMLKNYRHWPRYQEIRQTKAAEIQKNLVTHYQDAARINVELSLEAAAHTLSALQAGEIKGKDAAQVSQQAMVASGVALDKSLIMEGKPTVITQTQDLRSIVAGMEREFGFTIDGTAHEVPDEAEQPETAGPALIPQSSPPTRAREDTHSEPPAPPA